MDIEANNATSCLCSRDFIHLPKLFAATERKLSETKFHHNKPVQRMKLWTEIPLDGWNKQKSQSHVRLSGSASYSERLLIWSEFLSYCFPMSNLQTSHQSHIFPWKRVKHIWVQHYVLNHVLGQLSPIVASPSLNRVNSICKNDFPRTNHEQIWWCSA